MGVLVAAPTLLLNKTTSVTKTVTNQLFGKAIIRRCLCAAGKQRIKPVTIDGKDYYIMMLHPRQKYLLEVSVARDKYKHAQWVKRYNKWCSSRGEPLYQEAEGEIGALEGVRIKKTA